ncbi:MAG: dihydroorotate dehydrogenase electron transfer subunit [Methermicoccaceae archaeon]
MRPLSCTVVGTIGHAHRISTMFLQPTLEGVPHPGQFVMVWIRGMDEVPMAVSHYEKGMLGITVQSVGTTTEALCRMQEGDTLGLRGYYGNGFTLEDESALLIGGGLGMAPLIYLHSCLVKRGCHSTVCVGARTKDDMILLDEFTESELVVATDDGSLGVCGTVLDAMKDVKLEQFEKIYCCGPERMMAKVHALCRESGVLSRTEFSVQRYFKCATGVCGACCLDPDGIRVCKDGPVLSGEVLDRAEFGHYRRDSSGCKVMI